MAKVNKDFYNELPSSVCVILDNFIAQYGVKDWFQTAWNEYREHVMNSTMEEVRMPGYVFGKYISKDRDED